MKKYKDLLPGEVLDLSAEIALVNPTDTPIVSLLQAKGKVVPAKDVTVSWRERELNKTRGVKAEGSEAGAAVKSVRKLKSNICQIMEKVVSVSGTLNALNPNGIGSEFASELQDRLIELKMDTEYYVINGKKNTDSEERQMAGLLELVDETHRLSATGLAEDDIVDALQKVWEAGAQGELYCFVNASIKRQINKIFKDQITQIAEQGEQGMGIIVTRIETDFGNLNLVLDRHMPADKILIVDLDKVELAELRKTAYTELAKTGDYRKGMVNCENTIKLLNTKAGAVITVSPAMKAKATK